MRIKLRRTPLAAALCVTLAIAFASTSAGAGAAGADTTPAPQPSPSSASVLTPLLNLFAFGNTVGLPLACDAVSSLLPTASASFASVANELSSECQQLSNAGGGYLSEAIAKSKALALINPVLNPLIAEFASAAQTTGNNYGSSLAPFGPTIAGLGGTIAFFEGS